jgi:hypothetical protein
MALNNILLNSLDISVAAAVKLFVATNVSDYVSPRRDANLPLTADEIGGVIGLFEDCDAYLAETENSGEVEEDGDNVITGRYTLFTALNHLTSLQPHRTMFLANRAELIHWAATAEVETNDDSINENMEFFAILYHAYAKLRTNILVNAYREVKAETLAKYGITMN